MYLTRKQLAEEAQRELGIPLKVSRIDKEAMAGHGPPVAARFGRTELIERESGLEWARSLLSACADVA